MNVETSQKLKEAVRLIEAALAELGGASVATKTATRPASAPQTSLPGRIIALRDEGFFRQPRTAEEIYGKFQDQDKPTYYPCEPDRVVTALRRLAGRTELRKASKLVNGKKLLAYVW